MGDKHTKRRSEIWFNDMAAPGETGVYIECYGNYGITSKELQSGRPVIGIAQSGGDLTRVIGFMCSLAARVKDGIRDAGGIPFEFPMHPLQESCRRPTAALGSQRHFGAALSARAELSRVCSFTPEAAVRHRHHAPIDRGAAGGCDFAEGGPQADVGWRTGTFRR
jgi:hypothetical protein